MGNTSPWVTQNRTRDLQWLQDQTMTITRAMAAKHLGTMLGYTRIQGSALFKRSITIVVTPYTQILKECHALTVVFPPINGYG